MDCPLHTAHLCLLKRILGVEPATPNWSVLRECGHEPLQLYWFRAAVKVLQCLAAQQLHSARCCKQMLK
eukprot:980870-Pelagomonas_calceolata.AAC.1